MDTRYEAYCFADPLFYDSPGNATAAGADFLAALRPVPPGWEAGHRDVWVMLHERAILAELSGVVGVPAVVDHVVCAGHHFLVQERVPGEPLTRLLATRHPLIQAEPTADDIAGYRTWALAVADRVEQLVGALHRCGVVFGDLHPGNIVVAPDGAVHLIDFELASLVGERRPPGLGAAGYAAPPDRTGPDIDRYALACLRLALFLPLTAIQPLDRAVAGRLATAATERFGLPAAFAESIVDTLGAPPAEPAATGAAAGQAVAAGPVAGVGPVGVGPVAAALSWAGPAELAEPAPDWTAVRRSIVAGILASATPDRPDRLYPGDIGQFTHNGLGLAYGAAGVLYAIAAAGREPAPEDGLDWLVRAVRGRSVRQVGLYDGLYGIAYALDRLGRPADAAVVLDRARSVRATPAGATCSAARPVPGSPCCTSPPPATASRWLPTLGWP
jgi:hypothetical protein